MNLSLKSSPVWKSAVGAALVFCLSFVVARAAHRIGAESILITPASAHYSTTVNFRPGDREVVSNNPPIFTWFYNTNNMTGGEQNPNGFAPHYATMTNTFRLQIATNPSFSGQLAVDVRTPLNFYNFLAPLPTAHGRQFWWRVQYITNSGTYFTSATRMFTLAQTAQNWDRSMFASTNYYATNTVHPMFCYRAGEEAAIWRYAQTNDAADWANLLYYATGATNQPWWKDHAEWPLNATPNPKRAAPAVDGMTRATFTGAVLFMHRFSGDNQWTNASMSGWLMTNLAHNINWFVSPSNNYPMLDYGDSESPEGLRLAVATYDWLYDYLGSNPATFNGRLRTNALHAMRLTARVWNYHNLWFPNAYPLGQLKLLYDYNYAGQPAYCVQESSMAKLDSSHLGLDRCTSSFLGMIGGEEDPELRFHRDSMLNYYLARTSGFAGWAASHMGAYGYVDGQMTLMSRQVFSTYMLMHIAHPQLQLRNTEFFRRFPEWWSRMLPYGKRMTHGAYGDGAPLGYAGHFFGIKNRGLDLAMLTGSGYAKQLYDLNANYNSYSEGNQSKWDLIPTRFHFSAPAPATNSTAAVYPEDGFVVASGKSPSEFDCYTNGVGFSLKAPPRGNYGNHQVPDALSFDLWAYGAQITDGGGASLDDYCYHGESSPGLFVNGLGMSGVGRALLGHSQTVPMESSIVNYTNAGAAKFVYACADGTALFTNAYHTERQNVTKVKRHILFPRSKYWVIYDEFGSRDPSTFAFRWHVPWAFRYDANDVTRENETLFSYVYRPHVVGSNSFAATANGFTYEAGNWADVNYQNPPRVPVHVFFGNAPGQYGIFRATGTNRLNEPLGRTGVNGTANTNSTLNPFINGGTTYGTVNPDRAVGIWVTNRVRATNFNLLTVVVPQKPGVPAPIITRLDDNTVVVTYDGVTETNTFGTNYAGAFTYQVDLGRLAKTPPSPPNGGSIPPNVTP